MKQKREDEHEEKQKGEIDAPEDFNSNDDDNDSKGAKSSGSKIKIHRKRSHHSECLENQPSTKQETEFFQCADVVSYFLLLLSVFDGPSMR